MSSQIERRWGILAIAVLMFFVTVIVTQINGSKTSIYYCVWLMVGYYAYKANLDGIRSLMKLLIFINIGVLGLIILFFDDSTLGYLNSSGKVELMASVIVMLIPKTALYFYCKSQLEQNYSFSKYDNYDTEKRPTEIIDDHWEQAYKEVNGGERVTAVWARAFSEADGDENKAKARYVSMRVEQFSTANADNGHSDTKSKKRSKIVGPTYRYSQRAKNRTDEIGYSRDEIYRGITQRTLTCNHCERYGQMLIKSRINWFSKQYYLECPACGNTDS